MKKCAWCEYADVSKEKNVHDDDEVGAVDSEGDWICDECNGEAKAEARQGTCINEEHP